MVIRAVGWRVAALGATAMLAFLLLADLRAIFHWRPLARHTADRPQPAASDPGWPHRRGPHYSGRSDETDLADSWPPEGPPVLWSLELGRGYSGLTVVGGRLFTQTQSLTSQLVVCLDADSGALVWEHRYGWPYEPGGMYPGPRATPTWHQGRVYFAGPRGLVGCLHDNDGRPIWQVNVDEAFHGRGTDFGYSCSPLVENGLVILPVGGEGASVVALDARDGSTVWASGDEPASYCSAMPITLGGRRCVVTLLQNALALFDLNSGRLLCHEQYSTGYDEHAADPLYDEPYLMIACPFKSGAECYRLETSPDNEGDAQVEVSLRSVWHHRRMSNDVASCVLVDGYVYGFDLRDVQAKAHRPSRGEFRCLKLTTGEIQWSSDGPGHASVIVADGKLILFNDRGELLLARADHESYRELARTQVFAGEICWTAPALRRGRVYLRSPTRAACVYLGKSDRLDREQRQGARPASEVAGSGVPDFSWLVGGEREYAFDPATASELMLWYTFSLGGVLAVGAIAGGLAMLLPGVRGEPPAPQVGRAVFWGGAFLFAMAATPLYNRLWGEFVFTWPVCLFVAQQVAINTIAAPTTQPGGKPSRWRSLMVTFFLLGTCLAYYLICRRLSLVTEWVFLVTFLACWPLAVPAARRLRRQRPVWVEFLWAAAAFSVYFWAAGGILIWQGQ